MPDGQHTFVMLVVVFCMIFAAFWNLLFSIALRTILQVVFKTVGNANFSGDIVEIDTSKPAKESIADSNSKPKTSSVIVHSRKQRKPR